MLTMYLCTYVKKKSKIIECIFVLLASWVSWARFYYRFIDFFLMSIRICLLDIIVFKSHIHEESSQQNMLQDLGYIPWRNGFWKMQEDIVIIIELTVVHQLWSRPTILLEGRPKDCEIAHIYMTVLPITCNASKCVLLWITSDIRRHSNAEFRRI